jgi:predicted secreted protein
MTFTSAVVVFILLWWISFFLVLPWGIRRAGDNNEGHDAGAPLNPRLWLRVIVATAVALVLFAGAYWLIESQDLSFR